MNMSTPFDTTPSRQRLVLLGLAWLVLCSAQAQAQAQTQTQTLLAPVNVVSAQVTIPVVGEKCNERVQQVSSVTGQLHMPTPATAAAPGITTAQPLPAVVILHSNAGVIGVGSFYAKALNAAGIATLEVDSFKPRGVQDGRDRTAPVLCDRLQDAWGALLYLSKDPRIDASRIGITGFSSGGALAVMTGMGVRPRRLDRRDGPLPAHLVYAAHFALYPSCANLMDDPVRIRAWINPGRPQNWGATQKKSTSSRALKRISTLTRAPIACAWPKSFPTSRPTSACA